MDPHSQPSSNTEPSSSTADPVAPLTNAVSSIALDDHHHGMGSPPLEATQNPWSESVKLLSANSPRDAGSAVSVPSDAGQALSSEKHRPSALDPNVLDDSIAIGLKSRPASPQLSAATTAPISSDILSEFDPLASSVEQEAREAWESSESHPPPPPPRSATPAASDTPPAPPNKDSLSAPAPDGRASPSIIAAFPSLSALARTFSIPTPLRGRPLSVDSPQSVPSPNTISSFASQQQDPARPSTAPNASSGEPDSRGRISGDGSPRVLEDAAPFGSGTRTPETGQDGGNENAGDPPFDFQKFLDQMKSKGAEPVAKYLRSFLSNFAKRTFTVSDQVKIINDFLNFISLRMRETDTWKRAGDIEFDNAMEGMEKLVMNRLYDFTFTPQIARAVPPRPITTDDLERDRVLFQRISLFGWIEEKHLDIPVGEGSKGFLMFAQQELLKINHYKAPRDKLICILNCCKVIFGLIRHLKKEEGADSFVPILIYVVLKANPDNLLSNVEFISRFRNPEKLQSEAGYYLSSLMGAVSFIETMDHTSLSNITQEEFESQVEEAIQALPQSESHSPTISSLPSVSGKQPASFSSAQSSPSVGSLPQSPHAGEESAEPLSLPTPTIPSTTPGQTISEDARRLLQKTGDTISKPLNAIGRIFSEALDGAEGKLTYLPGPFAPFELGKERREEYAQGQSSGSPQPQHWSHPDQVARYGGSGSHLQTPSVDSVYSQTINTPYKPRVRRVPSTGYAYPSPERSPSSVDETPTRHGGNPQAPWTNSPLAIGTSNVLQSPRVQSLAQPQFLNADSDHGSAHVSRTPTPALDLAGVQQQIDVAHERAAEAAKETLTQIFPSVDTEVVDWVLEANEGDLGKSIEALLEMSSGV
ncbi:hypothetical protein HGRIS_005056 [Hohenbuehelia grisea]|uniref:Guanine nucleotide exchange factor Vps9 n=1 Tax=Hohenbuehelia grisea TaxID=104357 RepID=A0ABR3JEN5_9AGAR